MDDVNQEIHDAVLRGDLEAVRSLLKPGSNINQTNKNGNTFLHMAAQYGQENVIEYLVSHGADVEKATPDGQTPLHLAALLGLLKVTKVILSHEANMDKEDNIGYSALNGHLDVGRGAEVNNGDNDGMNALYSAAQKGHLDVTRYLFSQRGEVNMGDKQGCTALHIAAQNGYQDVTEYLISQGADVNNCDNNGWTALHRAAQDGHLEVTEYLISQGAEVDMGDGDGRTALHIAAQNGHLDVTEYLISQGTEANRGNDNGWTALRSAAISGHLGITKYLINQGTEANRGNDNGWTALHSAAHYGHLDVTKYLISEGAEVNRGNDNGWTALHSAAKEGHLDDTKYLISQGTEVNRGKDNGVGSLHIAAQEGHLNVTKYLISQGAEVNNGDNEGWTALHLGAINSRLDVTKYLIIQGAEVNKGDNDASTALHRSTQEGHLDVTKYLLTQGIRVNLCDRNGYNPLHIAALKGDLDETLVDVKDANGQTPLHLSSKTGSANYPDILAKHAKINGILDHRDDEGLTAIHLATQNGHTPVVESLVSRGASLNIQSHDGKTCLHEAIVLSDHIVRKEQTEGKPQQESSSSMNAGNELPIHGTSKELESSLTNPSVVVRQKLYDGNPVTSKRTSSDSVRQIVTRPRTSILVLVRTFLQAIIALVIILPGSLVLVAGSDITDRVALQAGKPGLVPFHFQWPPNSTSHGDRYFSLRFESQRQPFCINGEVRNEGFKSSSQSRRFTISGTDLVTSSCVNLTIDNVNTLDEDVYILTTVWDSFEDVRHETVIKEIVVQIPPGRAKCFITVSEHGDYPYEVHCRATTGSVATALSCYQNDRRIAVQGDITDNGQVTSGIFSLPDDTHFSCCSHDVTSYVSETMCNDFVWPHSKETTRQTVNTLPTSATTPTPQIESHVESGARQLFALPSMWQFTYLIVYLIVYFLPFLTMY